MLIRAVEIVGGGPSTKDIQLSGRRIASITDHVEHKRAGDVEIGFDSAIAFPGLINGHDHLEFDLYPALGIGPYADFVAWGEDIHRRFSDTIARIQAVPCELRVKAGIIKNIIAGVTTVVHHGKPVGAPSGNPLSIVDRYQYLHSLRLEPWWRFRLNRPDDRPVMLHLGEGINDRSRQEVKSLIRWNLRGRSVIGIHGISVDPTQAKHLAALVWCPASNLYLYGATAPVDALKQHTAIVFGTDSTLSAHWNIWEHFRDARKLELLNDFELIDAVTRLPAQVFSLAERGSLQVGATADLVIARRKHDDSMASFFATDVEDILLVLKEGSIVICDATLAAQLRLQDRYRRIVVGGVSKYWTCELDQWWQELKALDLALPFGPTIQ